MIRKTQIFSLILLFFVSTTGLPASYHLCQMMDDISAEECDMCMIKIEVIEPSCCSEETMEYPVNISSENPVCCQDEFVYNKVEDEFISNKSDVNFFASAKNLFKAITLLLPSVDHSTESFFYCDSSPPFFINPEIHITNHSLLI